MRRWACARSWRDGSAVIPSVMRRKSGIACLVVACVLGTGCGSGPELTFAADDAGAADGSTATPAVDGGPADAWVADVDAPATDAGNADTGAPLNACPATPPPPGVNACCGATACIDRENNNSCAQCGDCTQLQCQAGDLCCYGQNGKLGCKRTAADCK